MLNLPKHGSLVGPLNTSEERGLATVVARVGVQEPIRAAHHDASTRGQTEQPLSLGIDLPGSIDDGPPRRERRHLAEAAVVIERRPPRSRRPRGADPWTMRTSVLDPSGAGQKDAAVGVGPSA